MPQTKKTHKPFLALLATAAILTGLLLLASSSSAGVKRTDANPTPQPAALPSRDLPRTSELKDPGLYVFLDYSNLNPAQYPFIVGGHELFLWRDIERYSQGQYDWSVVDNWINAQTSLGKPVAIGFNSYDGQCCGGERLPTWYKQQHPDGYLTCQGVIIPKYWSNTYKNAWNSFIQAAAARYDNDPRVNWVVISTGMYGETIPAENEYDACLESNGLTSAGWVDTVNDITDMYHSAWQNQFLFIQYAPFFLSRLERRDITDYAASLGIGMKHNKLEVDGDDRVIDDPNYHYYRSGQYDAMLTWQDQLPSAWEAYRQQFPTQTETYWAFLNALDKHPTYSLINRLLIETLSPLEWEVMDFTNRYMGRTRADTPSVWVALRETEYTWYPQRGNFSFWLKQNNNVPGGQTVPLWNVTGDPRGRYTRRTDGAGGNPYMYFDVDDGYIYGGTNVVSITVTYLDQGTGTWRLEYDSVHDPYAVGLEVQKQNSGQWLSVSQVLSDVEFTNRQAGNDFRIWNGGDDDDIIHMVDVARLSHGEEVGVILQPDGDYNGVTDTSISEWEQTTNMGSRNRVYVRPDDVIAGLVKFDLTGYLPPNAAVTEAYLDLYVKSRSNESNWLDADIYALRREWGETLATWVKAHSGVAWSVPGANGINSDRSGVLLDSQRLSEIGVWERFDVTGAVTEWANGQPNYGLVIKGSSNSSGQVSYDFASREELDVGIRPRLVFTYVMAIAPPTPTWTPTNTPSPTPTNTPTATPTATPSPTPTEGPTSTPTPVPPADRTVTANLTLQPITVDGDLSDWTLGSGELLDRFTADFVHPRGVPEPADNSTRVWAAWNQNTLYLAARVFDDFLVADSGDIWRDDSLEFAFDGALDGSLTGPDDHTITAAINDRVTDWGVIDLPEVQRAVTPLSDGYIMELGIPLSTLQISNWLAGAEFGFNIGIHDDDDGDDWDHYMVWEGESTVSQPEAYGRMVLVDTDGCYFADVHPNTNHATPDDCDGDVDIADVQRVAACWMSPIGPACPAALDLNGSGVIDVTDIQISADNWGWRQG